MKLFMSLIMVVLLISVPNAWSDCKSDCLEDYESEINSCKTQYEDPEDADDLRECFENAKSEYDSCIEECDN
ncbi:MAG: hypothetical protein EHM36_08140 [Deltaproteobacteria bacterium]|nr:MAG: hypothetical protein EHM36_08140 [Deltaproteobacteria bacterium]